MSDGELEHILVQEMIKHQLHTFPQSSALPAAPRRAGTSPLPSSQRGIHKRTRTW